MSVPSNRFLAIAGLCAVALPALGVMTIPAETSAQTALPGIVVNAPSPDRAPRTAFQTKPTHTARRGTTTRPSTAPRPEVASAPTPPSPPANLPGTLPIVTDQFATVTVVPNEEIRRNGAATLGDLLNNKPGITGSSLRAGRIEPAHHSRPRRQSRRHRGERHREQRRVRSRRGPFRADRSAFDQSGRGDPRPGHAALRLDGDRRRRQRQQQSHSRNLAVRAAADNADLRLRRQGAATVDAPWLRELRDPRSGVERGQWPSKAAVLLDAGGGNFAIHADAFARRTEDYAIPGGVQKTYRRSRTRNGGFGRRFVLVRRRLRRRGDDAEQQPVPHSGPEGEELGTRIDAHQTKFTAKGEYRPDAAAVDAIRFWVGATDYKHNELGLANAADPASDGVRQTFTNKEQEGRLEVQFAPSNLRFAALTTAMGVQAAHQELTASSPDDPFSPLNGLWDPNQNGRLAGYIFNEFKFSDTTKAQVAGRIEHVNLNGSTPSAIPEQFDLTTDPGAIGAATSRALNFTPESASVGLIQNLPWNLVGQPDRTIRRTRAKAGRIVLARRA